MQSSEIIPVHFLWHSCMNLICGEFYSFHFMDVFLTCRKSAVLEVEKLQKVSLEGQNINEIT